MGDFIIPGDIKQKSKSDDKILISLFKEWLNDKILIFLFREWLDNKRQIFVNTKCDDATLLEDIINMYDLVFKNIKKKRLN